MKIALALGTSAGGVGRHVHGLATSLLERGHEVVVLCPAEVEEMFAFREAGASWVEFAVTDRPSPRGDAAAVATLRGRLAGADVVHAHGLRAGALACLAARGLGTSVVVTLHNAPPSGRVLAGVYAVLERIVARRADVVLGVSSDLVARQQALGARHTALAVIPAPPAPEHVRPRPEVRDELGVPFGHDLVVVVARLAPQKGLDLLLDAVRGLSDLPLEVVVAGEGPLRPHLEQRIASEGLPVRLLGARGDVADLLAAADVVVSSAHWEGQPVALQEALHADAAIVATDVGGTAAVVGDAALLVPAGNTVALARGIRAVLTDGTERDRLRSLASLRSVELPDADAAVEAALAAYRLVLA